LPGSVSLIAPVVTETVAVPIAVGVPETGQEIDAPIASEATGGAGIHAPTVTPSGKPVTAHETLRPAAVADALFVHLMTPTYGTPTVATAGSPVRSGATSEPVTLIDAVAVLLPRLTSLVAPVVPLSVALPTAVGVPDTVHVIAAPGATDAAGTDGAQTVLKPAGRPATAQLAAVAAIAGAAALLHLKVPVYATPMLAVVGNVVKSMLISELDGDNVADALLLPPIPVPPLVSLVAPVVTPTVLVADEVGVPVTGHEMLAPIATVAGAAGVHTPSAKPAGRPVTVQEALVAGAVDAALFVHLIVPV
jgi:hypothetical protein